MSREIPSRSWDVRDESLLVRARCKTYVALVRENLVGTERAPFPQQHVGSSGPWFGKLDAEERTRDQDAVTMQVHRDVRHPNLGPGKKVGPRYPCKTSFHGSKYISNV